MSNSYLPYTVVLVSVKYILILSRLLLVGIDALRRKRRKRQTMKFNINCSNYNHVVCHHAGFPFTI